MHERSSNAWFCAKPFSTSGLWPSRMAERKVLTTKANEMCQCASLDPVYGIEETGVGKQVPAWVGEQHLPGLLIGRAWHNAK
jgi:hypothetical protein